MVECWNAGMLEWWRGRNWKLEIGNLYREEGCGSFHDSLYGAVAIKT
jgi:hypothetical protein